jgi:hypothetical protein
VLSCTAAATDFSSAAVVRALLGAFKAKLGKGKDKVRSVHRAFCEALVSELHKDHLLIALKQVYITKNTTLPKI